MLNRQVNVDFSVRCGSIKPIVGANGGPVFGAADLSDLYRELSLPVIRATGKGVPYTVDLHTVFPDPSLDERMELSYCFGPTDARLLSIRDTGAEIFLRLGESEDGSPVGEHIRPPRDPDRWARICERIIAHYNEGWANGFKLRIRYVEIWSRPDTPLGWRGTPSEYYELYRSVATRLKSRFPRLRVGGYSSGGFFSLNHYNAGEEVRRYVGFLEGFLSYISSGEHPAPLDFLSWRCIADTPEEISLHASYARGYLNQYGFKRAESIISELDLAERSQPSFCRREYPAELASALIIAQRASVDMAFYADSDPRSQSCALYSLDDNRYLHPYAPLEVLRALCRLYSLRSLPDVSEDYRREIYTMAATDGECGAVLLVTREYSGTVDLNIRGSCFDSYSIRGIIGGGDRGAGHTTELTSQPLGDGRITLKTGRCEVYFITLGRAL